MHLQVSHLQGPHEHDLVSQAQLVQGLEQLQLVEQAMVVVGGMVVGVVVRESVMELVLRFELVLCGVWRVGVWRTSLCVSPPPSIYTLARISLHRVATFASYPNRLPGLVTKLHYPHSPELDFA